MKKLKQISKPVYYQLLQLFSKFLLFMIGLTCLLSGCNRGNPPVSGNSPIQAKYGVKQPIIIEAQPIRKDINEIRPMYGVPIRPRYVDLKTRALPERNNMKRAK